MSARTKAFLLFTAISTIILTGISPAAAGGVFRFPLFFVPPSLDPVQDNSVSTYHIAQQVYDGLVAFDSNLRVVPGLAENWTVSRDGREYLFSLRKGVRFHSGQVVDAGDVVASLTRIFGPESQAVPDASLERIEGARAFREGKADSISGLKAVDYDQVRITLTEPYAPFLSFLAMPMTKIVPEELALDPGRPLNQRPMGTGPFQFVSWADNVITLKSNQDYFQGSPSLDEVRFVFYPKGDRDKAFQDFLDGNLEGCPLPSGQDLDDMKQRGYQVFTRPRLSLLFYGFNVGMPPLNDARVRMALALAYDRRTRVEEDLGGIYFPAFQVLPPGMPGYTPDNALLDYNPERASELLTSAGYPGGEGFPEIAIASASHSDFAVKELQLFSEDLARVGIKVKPVFVDGWDVFSEGLQQGKYSLFRYALYADVPDPDDFLAPLFETDSPLNYSRFSDQDVDALLETARGESDPVKRMQVYRRVEKTILDESPVIPVLYISTRAIFQGHVKGIDLPATGTTYLPLHRTSITAGP